MGGQSDSCPMELESSRELAGVVQKTNKEFAVCFALVSNLIRDEGWLYGRLVHRLLEPGRLPLHLSLGLALMCTGKCNCGELALCGILA